MTILRLVPLGAGILVAAAAVAAPPSSRSPARPPVTAQPPSADAEAMRQAIDPARRPMLSRRAMATLMRRRIKYVFVIFNENESFDHEYGTFPGANGLYSTGAAPREAAKTPGFVQSYVDQAGATDTVRPFRLGPQQNATVMDSVDHSHKGLASKLHVVDGVARMDGFAQVEFSGKSGPAKTPDQAARGRQYANLVMSYVDCDTVPFFWRWANRFTLFDNIFATEDTPSTPNAIALLAGQAGETQWVKHGTAGTSGPVSGTINGAAYAGSGTTQGVPVLADPNPYWGSQFDPNTPRDQPASSSPEEKYGRRGDGPYNVSTNLTFATIPLDAMGKGVRDGLAGDRHPAANQADIQRDIPAIEATRRAPVAWRWYQNGYDHEPTDQPGVASHANFVAHHEGPQYFGYLADNDRQQVSLKGEGDFFADVAAHRLPKEGGIIYVRGGFGNLAGMHVPIQNRAWPAPLTDADVKAIDDAKSGDDDHPGYADHQISEAMNARVVNAIAADPELWAQSAVVITYDESDGFYDHVPPRILSYGPDHLPLSRGVRVPLLVISPYARAHAVAHAEGDHNAVIETIEEVFGLKPLATLPDEAAALKAGDSPAFNQFGPPGFRQRHLGPRDLNTPETDSLMAAFDPARLAGTAPILPGSYAMIPSEVVERLPHYGGDGCRAIGVVPEDRRQGIATAPPPGFNTLPSTLPRFNRALP